MNTFDNLEASVEMKSKKNYFLLAIFIVIVCLVFFLYSRAIPSTPQGNILAEHATQNNNLKTQTTTALPNAPAVDSAEVKLEEPLVTYADVKDKQVWDANHGYYSIQDRAIYQNYSDEILAELGQKGDFKALEAMGNKLISRREADKAIPYFWQAAALGSTTALQTMAILVDHPYESGETKEMRQQYTRETALEALALKKTAELRGDKRIAQTVASAAVSMYEIKYGSLTLSSEEEQHIDQRGNAIYNQLQARRTELGLGDFDNSVPKLEQLILEERERQTRK